MGANLDAAGVSADPAVWYHRLRGSISRWDLTPAQIAAIYLVLGLLALYVSDVLLVGLVADPATLSRIQAAKGGVEVLATAGLVYVLARRSRRALRTTNDRLERQQEELQVLHRVLRHNLRHDVNIVQGYGSSLDEVVEDGQHRAWCAQIVDAAERIAHYTEQANKIDKVAPEDAPETIELAELVARVAGSDAATGAGAVELSVPDSAPVRAHPMLESAVAELVGNAVAHHDGESPHVAVTVDPDAGPAHRTELVVADDGPGIPEGVRRTIEQRGETQLLHLEGLGLWLVSWVLAMSDAELSIEDRDPRGTTVRLRLPAASLGPSPVAAVSERLPSPT